MATAVPTFVSNLTASPSRRRKFDAVRRIFVASLAGLSLLIVAAASANVPRWQPVADIAATAEAFLRDRAGDNATRTTVRAGRLDPRLKLAFCSEPLDAFLRPGVEIRSKTIVGVRCDGDKPWKIFVPVETVVTDTVLVASRTLPQGHILTEEDLVARQDDVSRLRFGYFSDVRLVVGRQLKSQLLAGRELTPRSLKVDLAIRKGQSVTLVAGTGGVDIRMGGKALMDGALGQRIRVENVNSGRTVEGIVRSREHVEVLLPQTNRFFHAKPKVSPSVADTRSSNNDR